MPARAFDNGSWWWVGGEVLPNSYVDFGADVVLDSPATAGKMRLTCGSLYTLWVNGTWVLHGPPREVAPWQYYDEVDILPYLQEGKNRIRIRAHHLGIDHQSHEACLAGVLLDGEIITASGERTELAERMLWRAGRSVSYLAHSRRLNGCTGFSEAVDLTIPFPAWLTADAQALGEAPVVVASHPLPDRPRMLASDITLVTGKTTQAKEMGVVGGYQVWDFGETVFGFIEIGVRSESAMECPLLHGESLTKEGLPDWEFGGGEFREILVLPAEESREWESFDKRALRYLALPSGVRVEFLRVREYHRNLTEVWKETPRARALSLQDRAIVEAAARTVLLCADDLLNDCPRRERAQYNDPAVYMEAFPLLFGTWEPFARWLKQYLRGADEKGILRACYPSPSKNKFVIPDFSISLASTLDRYVSATDDCEMLREAFPAAEASLNAYEEYADSTGLLCDVPEWVFLCNSFELAKLPRSAALNALWAAGWKHLGALARLLGREEEARKHEAKSEKLRRAWRQLFYREGRILDSDASLAHERLLYWNFHYEAELGYFESRQTGRGSFVLRFSWEEAPEKLWIVAAGRVRVWAGEVLILDETPKNPWTISPVFSPWCVDAIPGGCKEFLAQVDYNGLDWELYVAGEKGKPQDAYYGRSSQEETPQELRALAQQAVRLRPWCAPRYNQITVGYAVASGMLEEEEARGVLESCLRERYEVPYLKRMTPLVCTITEDIEAMRNRVVLCNTPQSLAFFCRALVKQGKKLQAQQLCRLLFGMMLDRGATTLWEEFAPRSSLCHAWGAMCVPILLEAD